MFRRILTSSYNKRSLLQTLCQQIYPSHYLKYKGNIWRVLVKGPMTHWITTTNIHQVCFSCSRHNQALEVQLGNKNKQGYSLWESSKENKTRKTCHLLLGCFSLASLSYTQQQQQQEHSSLATDQILSLLRLCNKNMKTKTKSKQKRRTTTPEVIVKAGVPFPSNKSHILSNCLVVSPHPSLGLIMLLPLVITLLSLPFHWTSHFFSLFQTPFAFQEA